MVQYKISYVLTTYNKLPYLKQVLSRLIAAREVDEEIVVCDGGSSDGTSVYLRELYDKEQIQQLVSEKDKGEAHGFNKGMLLAKGEIIKIVTDDDAFSYPTIREAVNFMLQNPSIDVVIGYNADTYLDNLSAAALFAEPANNFQLWLQNKKPFWMIGLPLIIRRSSLALTGLFFTGVVLVDADFTYRITSLNVNIAWCTGVLSMHVSTPDGNYNRMSEEIRKAEFARLHSYYVSKEQKKAVSRLDRVKAHTAQLLADSLEAIKRPIRPAKRKLFSRLGLRQLPFMPDPERFATGYIPIEGELLIDATYRVCDEFLISQNAKRKIDFLYKQEDVHKVFKQ